MARMLMKGDTICRERFAQVMSCPICQHGGKSSGSVVSDDCACDCAKEWAGETCGDPAKSGDPVESGGTARSTLVFPGDFNKIVGNNKASFLMECTASVSNNGALDVECVDVRP